MHSFCSMLPVHCIPLIISGFDFLLPSLPVFCVPNDTTVFSNMCVCFYMFFVIVQGLHQFGGMKIGVVGCNNVGWTCWCSFETCFFFLIVF